VFFFFFFLFNTLRNIIQRETSNFYTTVTQSECSVGSEVDIAKHEKIIITHHT